MEQAVENVQRALQDTSNEQPAAVFLNEVMLSVKKLEDLVKELRKTVTAQVDTRNLTLMDFSLEKSYVRSLEKSLDIINDFETKWGQSVKSLVEKDVLSIKIGKAEDLIKSIAGHLGKIPEGVKQDEWVKAETARYMAPNKILIVALKSNTRQKPSK